MKIKVIKTEEEYAKALAYLEALGDRPDFETNQGLVDEFELISALIEAYDKANYPVGEADPIEVILLKMDYMGLKRKDLENIASSGVLSEVFNKRRGLSKQMIRDFSKLLNIDQDLLNTKYEIKPNQRKTAKKTRISVSKKPVFDFVKPNDVDMISRFKKRIETNCMLFNMSCAQ